HRLADLRHLRLPGRRRPGAGLPRRGHGRTRHRSARGRPRRRLRHPVHLTGHPDPGCRDGDGAGRGGGQGVPRSGNECPADLDRARPSHRLPAVFALYEVGTVKQVSTDSGIRTYVAVDGGMSDNIRTALYDADYSCTLANRASSAEPAIVRVVGKHCESGDIIVRDEYMGADVTAGDLVAVPSTGAYCRPLASNYNHIPRPGVLAVDADRVEWIVLPEDHSQMFPTDPGMADGGPSSR